MATQSIRAVRLPRWLLPQDWPRPDAGEPALADLEVYGDRIHSVRPHTRGITGADETDLSGALALPGLLEAHAHLDKAFTRARLGRIEPGLLPAISASHEDRVHWTDDDLRDRADRALCMAWKAGVTQLRTHVDWWSPQAPRSWHIMAEVGHAWRNHVQLQRVALIPLPFFARPEDASSIAGQLKGDSLAILGAFIHSSNHSDVALENLLRSAQSAALDLDLHIDEELSPQALGLAKVTEWVWRHRYEGHIVCGHACALAVHDSSQALALLDEIAKAPITLVALPTTNLLLQDAHPARTPRQRGLTLLKEARERGIPVLIASDNVQDAFCSLGDFDPVNVLGVAVMAGQLDDGFDTWSASICRTDWLGPRPTSRYSLEGKPATLIVFPDADVHTWPANSARRVLRASALNPVSWSNA